MPETDELTVQRTVAIYGPPDDVLTPDGCLDPADREYMRQGCHFDYRAQVWREGHDHAHFWSVLNHVHDPGPLAFCGADLATCENGRG